LPAALILLSLGAGVSAKILAIGKKLASRRARARHSTCISKQLTRRRRWPLNCISRHSPMDQTLLTAAAGMRSRLETLELISNNIANVDTAGFKADREFYNLFAAAEAEANVWGEVTWMPVVEASATDFRQGVLTRTAAPLDAALEGPGFFAVEGSASTLYTRNGGFRRSRAGRLETADGYAVLGDNNRPLDLPAGEIKIGEDGTVWAGRQNAGRLQVVEFSSPQALNKVGYSYFQPSGGTPQPAARTLVQQGHLEGANVNPAEMAVRLVEVTRQFEMLSRAVTVVANDMNRRGVDEIPRSGT
jgi:flagellar basal-body rod protein FlgF